MPSTLIVTNVGAPGGTAIPLTPSLVAAYSGAYDTTAEVDPSYNVSTYTEVADTYTYAFTNAMAAADYPVMTDNQDPSYATSTTNGFYVTPYSRLTGSVSMNTNNNNGDTFLTGRRHRFQVTGDLA